MDILKFAKQAKVILATALVATTLSFPVYAMDEKPSDNQKEEVIDKTIDQPICGGYIQATINDQPVSIPRHEYGKIRLENGELIEHTSQKCYVTDVGKITSISFPDFSLGIIRENFEPQQNFT